MSIATNLKTLRKNAGLTQRELAQKAGLPLRSIINYENGLREPNSKAMVTLEQFFKVSGEVLRGNTPLYGAEDTEESKRFFGEALSYAVRDFDIRCSEGRRGQAEACDALMIAYSIVNGFLDDPKSATEDCKNFNELLICYRALSDAGKIEMLRRTVEYFELEQLKAQKEPLR